MKPLLSVKLGAQSLGSTSAWHSPPAAAPLSSKKPPSHDAVPALDTHVPANVAPFESVKPLPHEAVVAFDTHEPPPNVPLESVKPLSQSGHTLFL
jgi:hypothetical protein